MSGIPSAREALAVPPGLLEDVTEQTESLSSGELPEALAGPKVPAGPKVLAGWKIPSIETTTKGENL